VATAQPAVAKDKDLRTSRRRTLRQAGLDQSADSSYGYARRAIDSDAGLGLKDLDRIVIDAGHGGHDTGTIDRPVDGKGFVLDVRYAGKTDSAEIAGRGCGLHAADDTFVPLEEADRNANERGRIWFISIHAKFRVTTRKRAGSRVTT